MYTEQVLDHFHHPRNVGEIETPSAVAEASNPVCGDTLKLWILVLDGRIAEVTFKVQGCVPAVACASWLTEAIKDKPMTEIVALGSEEIERGLGSLPQASRHASTLAVNALRKALEKINI